MGSQCGLSTSDMWIEKPSSFISEPSLAVSGEFGDPLTKWSSGSAVLHAQLMTPLRLFSRPPVIVSIGSMYTLASAVTRDARLLPKIGLASWCSSAGIECALGQVGC